MGLKCYICQSYDPKRQSLYRIPHRNEENQERWRLWLKILDEREINLNRIRICSDHFLQKKPAKKDDCLNVDWAPSRNLGRFSKNKNFHQYFLRQKNKPSTRENKVNLNDADQNRPVEASPDSSLREIDDFNNQEAQQADDVVSEHIQSINRLLQPAKKRKFEILEQKFFFTKEIQTELSIDDINSLYKHYQEAIEDRNKLLLQISTLTLDYEYFKNNDKKTLFYTGLPTWKLLNHLFCLVETFLPEHGNAKLSPFQMFVLTLMKLRLNHLFIDLGYRFQIDATTASKYFHRCICILFKKFYGSKLIFWPDDPYLIVNTPSYFRSELKDLVTVVIDCFEIFIERSSVLRALAQSWSQYKHHNTIKFLIGISMSGAIIFISPAFGGRCSDKEVTLQSGILNKLKANNLVLADKGFLIENEVKEKEASLRMPCFVKNLTQLEPEDVETTRETANLRIHVERLISTLRNKMNICSDLAPMSAISKKNDYFDYDLYDKIIYICCCLVNLCPPTIPNDFEM